MIYSSYSSIVITEVKVDSSNWIWQAAKWSQPNISEELKKLLVILHIKIETLLFQIQKLKKWSHVYFHDSSAYGYDVN